MSPDECRQIYQEFGEIRASVTNHIHDRGLAFITYYDMRSAMKAVEQMQNYQNRGRNPVTGYAYHVPDATGLDARDLALTVLLRPAQEGARLSPEAVKLALSAYGDVSSVTEAQTGGWIVDFFDSRAVQKVVGEVKGITIGGFVFVADVVTDRDALLQPHPQPYPQTQVVQGYPPQYGQIYGRLVNQCTPELVQSLLKLQASMNPK
jgi:RNA recognition motif-containing protein